MPALEEEIKSEARRLGFELAGIAAAAPAETFGVFREWLDAGFAGEMGYLHRQAEARQHPRSVLANVRSVVMVALNYKPDGEDSAAIPASRGRVARYARGVDYHQLMWQQLDQLLSWIQERAPDCTGRSVVDTAPLLERDFARRAGLGWFGKNTMLLNKHWGSYFFLGALLLDLRLVEDGPHIAQHCGTCTACLDACPTDAFVGPGQLDARRCISYLTIEHRGPIYVGLREGMGDWVFGCDVCQEVCPWNRRPPAANTTAFGEQFPAGSVSLIELLDMTEEEFRRAYRHLPFWRPRHGGMRRNAAIALGNQGDPTALPALQRAAFDDDPVVRDAALWAIEKITGMRSIGCENGN
jgi:epoxyqueuosine reductase